MSGNTSDPPSAAQQLLTLCSTIAGICLLLYTPWIVRKLPHDWWIQFAPIWDAPYASRRQEYTPYCPEGHACFFLVGIEIIVLVVITKFVYKRVGADVIDYHDYSTYRRRHDY